MEPSFYRSEWKTAWSRARLGMEARQRPEVAWMDKRAEKALFSRNYVETVLTPEANKRMRLVTLRYHRAWIIKRRNEARYAALMLRAIVCREANEDSTNASGR